MAETAAASEQSVEAEAGDETPRILPKTEEEKLFKKKVRKAIDKRRAADAKKGKMEVNRNGSHKRIVFRSFFFFVVLCLSRSPAAAVPTSPCQTSFQDN